MGIRLEGTGVAELILDRPKVNALDAAMLEGLARAVERIEADDAIQGVLIRSTGKCFSAGLDLGALLDAERPAMTAFFEQFERTFIGLFECSKPIAAAIEGHAIAGGLVLGLVADFMAMAPGSYRLGLTELQVGVPFPDSAIQIVADAIPPRALRTLVYEAGLYGPEACFALGVGDALVPDPVAAARAWLKTVTGRPTATFRETKLRMRQAARTQMRAGHGPAAIIDALLSPEVKAAVRATLRR